MSRLQREDDNLRLALRWALERGEAEIAVRLGAALWRFWWALGHLGEGRRWLEVVLASGGRLSAAARARTLSGFWGMAPHALGTDPTQVEQAAAFFAESLELCRELGDARGVAVALGYLGVVAAHQGDTERARSLLEESLALLRELGDRERIAAALYSLGSLGLGHLAEDAVQASPGPTGAKTARNSTSGPTSAQIVTLHTRHPEESRIFGSILAPRLAAAYPRTRRTAFLVSGATI